MKGTMQNVALKLEGEKHFGSVNFFLLLLCEGFAMKFVLNGFLEEEQRKESDASSW